MNTLLYSSSHVSQIQILYPGRILPSKYYLTPWTADEFSRLISLEPLPSSSALLELTGFSAKVAEFYSKVDLQGNILSLGAGHSTVEIHCVNHQPSIRSIYCVDIAPYMDELSRLIPPKSSSKLHFLKTSIFDEPKLLNLVGPAQFDTIMINQVIYTLSDRELSNLLDLSEKLLKPGGSIYILCTSLKKPRTTLYSLWVTAKILLGERRFKPIGILRSPSHLIKIFKRHPRFQVIEVKSELPISYKLVLKA
ncbi:MAG: class I SAM-dependent methyltransferase [Bdellovibrionota bacterium]